MPHPKHRTTRSKGGKRRSHDALKQIQLAKCSKCGRAVKQHTSCPECGHYAGRRVVKIAADVEKRLAKPKPQPEEKEAA